MIRKNGYKMYTKKSKVSIFCKMSNIPILTYCIALNLCNKS